VSCASTRVVDVVNGHRQPHSGRIRAPTANLLGNVNVKESEESWTLARLAVEIAPYAARDRLH
jgi:hypothetical protein